MERIIRHFMGDVSFTSRNLQEIADMLEKDRDDSRSQDAEFSDDQAMSESYSLEPLSSSMMRMHTLANYTRPVVDNASRLFWRIISLEFLQGHSSQITESWLWS